MPPPPTPGPSESDGGGPPPTLGQLWSEEGGSLLVRKSPLLAADLTSRQGLPSSSPRSILESGNFSGTPPGPSPGTPLHFSARGQGLTAHPGPPAGARSPPTLAAAAAPGLAGLSEPDLPAPSHRGTLAEWKVDPGSLTPHDASVPGRCARGLLAHSLGPLSHRVMMFLAQRGELRPREIGCCSNATEAGPTLTRRWSDSNGLCPGSGPPESRAQVSEEGEQHQGLTESGMPTRQVPAHLPHQARLPAQGGTPEAKCPLEEFHSGQKCQCVLPCLPSQRPGAS